jgi:hypothetical protein
MQLRPQQRPVLRGRRQGKLTEHSRLDGPECALEAARDLRSAKDVSINDGKDIGLLIPFVTRVARPRHAGDAIAD